VSRFASRPPTRCCTVQPPPPAPSCTVKILTHNQCASRRTPSPRREAVGKVHEKVPATLVRWVHRVLTRHTAYEGISDTTRSALSALLTDYVRSQHYRSPILQRTVVNVLRPSDPLLAPQAWVQPWDVERCTTSRNDAVQRSFDSWHARSDAVARDRPLRAPASLLSLVSAAALGH